MAELPQLTVGMSTSEARDVLSQYGIDANEVLGASNISQTLNNPASNPDDLLGIRADIYLKEGVDEAQQEWLNRQKDTQDFINQYNTEQQQLGNRAVSVSKITGTQRQHELTNQGKIQNLQSAEALALQAYNLKKSSADEIFGIRESEVNRVRDLMVKYPEAGIKYSDSTQDITKKLTKMNEQAKKDAYKEALKEQLIAMGSSTKGLSVNELEKKLKKKNKEAIEEAKRVADLEYSKLEAEVNKLKQDLGTGGTIDIGSLFGTTSSSGVSISGGTSADDPLGSFGY